VLASGDEVGIDCAHPPAVASQFGRHHPVALAEAWVGEVDVPTAVVVTTQDRAIERFLAHVRSTVPRHDRFDGPPTT